MSEPDLELELDVDTPSAQLHRELQETIVRALATRRPILHHLNADTSWLLQIPRPASAVKHGGRVYYNVLIDPWFVGGQSDGARWFSQQWHREASRVGSVREVEELIMRVEGLAGGPAGTRKRKRERKGEGDGVGMEEGRGGTVIDAVAVSHEFTDHCHKETLLELDGDVPVLATEKAAQLISSWNHFRVVLTISTFTHENADWRDHSLPPLPSWLSISRLTAPKDALFYHSALLICFATHPFLPTTPKKRSSLLSIHGDGDDHPSTPSADAAECVVYTPHGIPYTALIPIEVADPPLHTLAFLHGLHDVSISSAQQLNLGAKNGVLAQRILQAKYWVATHDEVKIGGGLIAWFLRRRKWTVEEAVAEVRRDMREQGELEEKEDEGWEGMRFVEIGNGESRILE
ncbi:uncharacterized protein EI97DRAFT_436079 [Westerdykella ornata]|uniref:Uncharacterized protein n=1 Tax=Westerdykella ornata TaxID=318751 RepID=A0A6A6JB46_WESOR|nr:uncharacterized protein EI97DRAFT_436079 [Westerdykella ornata]KAF2273424.1 hypothetical protein EI97DRAFT_436079 [Westerdykella ornata]